MINPNHLNEHSPDTGNLTQPGTYFICGLLAATILMVDLHIPLGVASGVPYIVVILFSLKSPEKHFTLIAAAICTVFVGIGYIESPPAPDHVPFYQVLANRSLAIFAIWTTAILTLIQRDKTHALHEERLKSLLTAREIEIEKEKLKTLKATMRTVQDITGNFLNSMQLIQLEIDRNKTLSPETVNKLDELIQDTAVRINKLGNLEEIREKRMAGDLTGIDYEQPARKI
ncbi:MAG: hypothetical protein AABY47_03860 [Pseudomonadota bacterium]